MPKKIVIVGGSFAGHGAYKIIFDKFSAQDIEVTLVSKSDKSYFNVASPRLLKENEKLPQVAFLIEKFVGAKGGNRGKFVNGEAVEADFSANTLVVKTATGNVTLDYDILVIASGSKSQFAGFKVNDSFEDVEKAINSTAKQLLSAKEVAIIGGGATGVETAAEIATNYPNAAVTIYTGSRNALPAYPKLADSTTSKLTKLGVKIISGVRSEKITRSADSAEVTLDNGEVKRFDVVIESTKEIPYSQFVPTSSQDEAGYVVADKHMIVKGTKNVVALGDVLAGSGKTIVDIRLSQLGVYTDTMRYLLGLSPSPFKEYKATTNTIFVPISYAGGVGLLFGWVVPNFVVKFLKSKTFMIEKAGEWFE